MGNKVGTSRWWREAFLVIGIGVGLLACSGEDGSESPVEQGSQGGSSGSAAGGTSAGGSSAAGKGGAGGGAGKGGTGGGGGTAGAPTGGSGGSGGTGGTGGSAGSGGSTGCVAHEDCADKLPSTVNPAGCAEALCEAGACVFRAKDKDGDGQAAKFCKDLSQSVEIEVGKDCDDSDKTVFPGAWDGPDGEGHEASCDGVDNDCSGAADDSVLADGTSCSCKPGAVQACSQTAGGKTISWPLGEPSGICKYGEQKCVIDDATGVGKWGPCIGAIEPASEACNNADDDCDGKVDEPEDTPTSTWYYDGDGDGYAAMVPGTQTPFATIQSCSKPSQIPAECMVPGYCPGEPGSCCPPTAWNVGLTPSDCDDRSEKVSPLAKEVCSNGVDDNCNGQQDEFGALGEKTYVYDQDNDGFSDPNVVPITSCAPPDQPPPSCAAPPCPVAGWKEQGPSIQGGDCDDNSASIKPGALELCDVAKVDENCNGSKNEGCACADGEVLDCGSPDTCNFVPNGSTCVNGKFTQCTFEPKQKELFCPDQDNDLFCLGDSSCALYCPASTGDDQGPKAPSGWRRKVDCKGYADGKVDCNDSNASVNPDVKEKCNNGVDDNCNGQQDEFGSEGEKTYVYDQDNDGFSNPNVVPVSACKAPTTPPPSCAAPPCPVAGWKEQGPSIQGGDCNDNSASIKPGALELCDVAKVDENCNGSKNEGCACTDGEVLDCGSPDTCNFVSKGSTCVNGKFTQCTFEPKQKESFCPDQDNDLFCLGDSSCALYCPTSTPAGQGPKAPSGWRRKVDCKGYADGKVDCNDSSASVNPDVKEKCNNGVDDNCNGQQDEFGSEGEKTYVYDQDNDGFSNPNVVPVSACKVPTTPPPSCDGPPCPAAGWKEFGPSIQGGDCNDNSASIKPGALELCDVAKVDENCNGSKNEGCACTDGEVLNCGSPDTCNFVPNGATCVNGQFTQCSFEPKQKELFCPDQDNDLFCLGDASCALYCPSSTPTGHGPKAPSGWRRKVDCKGYADGKVDCNDSSASVNPDVKEKCNNGIDDNCSGQQDEFGSEGEKTYVYDQDNDGFSNPNVVPVSACKAPTTPPPSCDGPPCPVAGWKEFGPSIQGGDCNDNSASIKPGALELCDAAKVDENCNGTGNEGCACTNGEQQDCGSPDTCNFVPNGSTCVNGQFTLCPEPRTKELFCKDQDNDLSCLEGDNCALYCPASTPAGQGPKAPAGYRLASTCSAGMDCNDGSASIKPGAPETCGDGVDSDCDGDAGGEDPDFGVGQECAVSNGVGACAAGGTKVCAGMGTSCSAKPGVGENTCQTSPFTSSLGSSWDWNCSGTVEGCTTTCTSASGPSCMCNSSVVEVKKVGTYNPFTGNYSTDTDAVNPCAPTDNAAYCAKYNGNATLCQKAHVFFDNCCDPSGSPGVQTCQNPCGKKTKEIRCSWNSSTSVCSAASIPICNATVYNNANRFFGCR